MEGDDKAKHEEVVDISFLPCIVRPIFYQLVGRYLFKSDEFPQLLRKVASIAYFIAGFNAALVGFFFFYMATLGDSDNPDFTAGVSKGSSVHIPDLMVGVSFMVFAVMVLIAYAGLRVRQHVSGGMVALALAACLQLQCCHLFFSSDFSVLFMCTLLVGFTIMMDSPAKIFFNGSFIFLQFASFYNEAYQNVPGAMILRHPDVRPRVGMIKFQLMTASWPPMMCVYFILQSALNENKRQVRDAKKSVDLAEKMVEQLRRYNTEHVRELLLEAKTASQEGEKGAEGEDEGKANARLLESFEAMVGNLESYRPFLPNYLFLGSGSGSGEDDAMSILSDFTPLAAFEMELMNDDDVGGDDQSPPGNSPSRGSTPESGSSDDREDTERNNKKKQKNNKAQKNVTQDEANAGAASPPFTMPPASFPNVLAARDTINVAPAAAPAAASSYRGIISQAWVEIQSNEWFSTRLIRLPFSAKTVRQQRGTMSSFTEALFDLAQTTKASIHSLVGDTVQLTWNATHRVAEPETKATTFLLRLRQALAISQPDLKLAVAACSGPAEVHNMTSQGTCQRAMYVDIPWLPCLEALFALAKRYKTLIVDANTESGAHYHVAAQGVDIVRYIPKVALVPGTGEPGVGSLNLGELIDPKGFPLALPDTFDTLLGVQGPQQEEAAKTFLERKPVHHTIAYELVRRKFAQENEDAGDWLYSDRPEQAEPIEPIVTKALLTLADGRGQEAAKLLTGTPGLGGGGGGKYAAPTARGEGRSGAYTSAVLGDDGQEVDPDHIPDPVAVHDPIAKAVALAAAEAKARGECSDQAGTTTEKKNLQLLQRLTQFCTAKSE